MEAEAGSEPRGHRHFGRVDHPGSDLLPMRIAGSNVAPWATLAFKNLLCTPVALPCRLLHGVPSQWPNAMALGAPRVAVGDPGIAVIVRVMANDLLDWIRRVVPWRWPQVKLLTA